jgi:hypothetical protein
MSIHTYRRPSAPLHPAGFNWSYCFPLIVEAVIRLCMKNGLINTLLVVVSMATAYVLLEVGSTWYFGRSLGGSYFVYSGSNTTKFDPISGYRLTREITFMTRITEGLVEYFGFYKGNNRGFPGRDFTPERQDQRKRFAVFGDSFTHADYLARSWPAYVEDLTVDRGRPIQLLNFALDGSGLANWWSIIKGEVDGYQLDGVIFAVVEGDLFRTFFMLHTENGKEWLGFLPYWNPARYPKTLADALPFMPELTSLGGAASYIVEERRFWDSLSGAWKPPGIGQWFIQHKISEAISALRRQPQANFVPPPPGSDDAKWREFIITDIAATIKRHGWKPIVVYLPSQSTLLARKGETQDKAETRRFAQVLGASFHDSTELYAGMTNEQIREHFLPYDQHWNLAGSDLFGRYVFGILQAEN